MIDKWYASLLRLSKARRLRAAITAVVLLAVALFDLPFSYHDPLWIFRSLVIACLVGSFCYFVIFLSGRSPRWLMSDTSVQVVWTRRQLRALHSQREAQLKRLRWRCRRGTRELDVLLGGWLDARAATAGEPELAAFDELLDQPDPQLWDWLLVNSRPPRVDWQDIVDAIRADHRI